MWRYIQPSLNTHHHLISIVHPWGPSTWTTGQQVMCYYVCNAQSFITAAACFFLWDHAPTLPKHKVSWPQNLWDWLHINPHRQNHLLQESRLDVLAFAQCTSQENGNGCAMSYCGSLIPWTMAIGKTGALWTWGLCLQAQLDEAVLMLHPTGPLQRKEWRHVVFKCWDFAKAGLSNIVFANGIHWVCQISSSLPQNNRTKKVMK